MSIEVHDAEDRLYRLYVLPGWMVQPTAVMRVVQPRQVLMSTRADLTDRGGGTAPPSPLTRERRFP